MIDELQEALNLFLHICPKCNKVFKHASSKSRHMKNCAVVPYKNNKRKAEDSVNMTYQTQEFKR